ncbi:TIGR03618 family F420-dependent PPOX class oxidoreductase [Crossiella sp. CA-258035]|uniref:TIGR03618 family F420-dependent PPOX class oxidoreductase n=1 Tax=Crossiella sp. CA-258035 TaxID=2981138 RepID=UPI0024BD3A8C|nr:TIGR03618 family F420-dependent PPOX class oxidoreductase [Crossiella sp. CA-258035]WHT22003.1 TIGR03618 family F420-dependent PPOX class oxidoreductase [Crossiella sp. CA-258035]
MTLSPEVREWLARPLFWHLATLNADGSPQVTPMWVEADGDRVLVNTALGRVKEENLRRDPRVSLSATWPEDPYDRVEIRGTVVAFVTGETAEAGMDRLARWGVSAGSRLRESRSDRPLAVRRGRPHTGPGVLERP